MSSRVAEDSRLMALVRAKLARETGSRLMDVPDHEIRAELQRWIEAGELARPPVRPREH